MELAQGIDFVTGVMIALVVAAPVVFYIWREFKKTGDKKLVNEALERLSSDFDEDPDGVVDILSHRGVIIFDDYRLAGFSFTRMRGLPEFNHLAPLLGKIAYSHPGRGLVEKLVQEVLYKFGEEKAFQFGGLLDFENEHLTPIRNEFLGLLRTEIAKQEAEEIRKKAEKKKFDALVRQNARIAKGLDQVFPMPDGKKARNMVTLPAPAAEGKPRE